MPGLTANPAALHASMLYKIGSRRLHSPPAPARDSGNGPGRSRRDEAAKRESRGLRLRMKAAPGQRGGPAADLFPPQAFRCPSPGDGLASRRNGRLGSWSAHHVPLSASAPGGAATFDFFEAAPPLFPDTPCLPRKMRAFSPAAPSAPCLRADLGCRSAAAWAVAAEIEREAAKLRVPRGPAACRMALMGGGIGLPPVRNPAPPREPGERLAMPHRLRPSRLRAADANALVCKRENS